jgi:hypothetical protein
MESKAQRLRIPLKGYLSIIYGRGFQAARKAASAPAARSELKYRSRVLIAASKTRWQSEQAAKWRLISSSTGVDSRPSKYQQIKWIVSLQLIYPIPQPTKGK